METNVVVWVRENPNVIPPSFLVEIDKRNDSNALLVRYFDVRLKAEVFARALALTVGCDCYDSDTGVKYV